MTSYRMPIRNESSDQRPATYPAVCPRCHRNLELTAGTIAPDDGSFLFHCEHCKQDVSGTLSSASPREN